MTTPVDNLRVSGQAAEAIQNANRLVQRDIALQSLRKLLDPERQLSTWALAGQISDHLRRFRVTAWPRMQAGHREPRSALEAALMHCCDCCPTSQTKLHPLLCDLRLGV